MSVSPESIRQAIANNLSAVTGVQASPWNLGTNFQTPVFQISGNGPIQYDGSFGRGTDRLTFVVQAITGTVDDIGAQRLLSTFVQGTGATSVKTAIESDRTLGSLVGDLRVTEYSGDRIIVIPNGAEYLIGEWTVDVLVSP